MDEAAALDAIRAAPDDDGPRLVWADELLARGDPRGELIAVQCRLETTTGEAREGLLRRQAELVQAHGERWVGRLPSLVTKWSWRRGFVDHVEMTLEQLVNGGHEIAAAAPLVSALTLTGLVIEVSTHTPVETVEQLWLNFEPRIASALDAIPFRLTSLEIPTAGIDAPIRNYGDYHPFWTPKIEETARLALRWSGAKSLRKLVVGGETIPLP